MDKVKVTPINVVPPATGQRICLIMAGHDVAGYSPGSYDRDMTKRLRWRCMDLYDKTPQEVSLSGSTITGLTAPDNSRVSLLWWDNAENVRRFHVQRYFQDGDGYQGGYACADALFRTPNQLTFDNQSLGHDWNEYWPSEYTVIAFVGDTLKNVLVNWTVKGHWLVGKPCRVVMQPRNLLILPFKARPGDPQLPPEPASFDRYAGPTDYYWMRKYMEAARSMWYDLQPV